MICCGVSTHSVFFVDFIQQSCSASSFQSHRNSKPSLSLARSCSLQSVFVLFYICVRIKSLSLHPCASIACENATVVQRRVCHFLLLLEVVTQLTTALVSMSWKQFVNTTCWLLRNSDFNVSEQYGLDREDTCGYGQGLVSFLGISRPDYTVRAGTLHCGVATFPEYLDPTSELSSLWRQEIAANRLETLSLHVSLNRCPVSFAAGAC